MELPAQDEHSTSPSRRQLSVNVERPTIPGGRDYHSPRTPVGSFMPHRAAAGGIDADRGEADLRDGVLPITLPKRKAQAAKDQRHQHHE